MIGCLVRAHQFIGEWSCVHPYTENVSVNTTPINFEIKRKIINAKHFYTLLDDLKEYDYYSQDMKEAELIKAFSSIIY